MCPEHESQSPEAGRFSELDTGHDALRSLPVPRDEPAVGHSVDLASRRLTGTRTGYSVHRGTSTVALRACREGHTSGDPADAFIGRARPETNPTRPRSCSRRVHVRTSI